jgi:Tfp pilus assembly pilus retraction ATPase PilT
VPRPPSSKTDPFPYENNGLLLSQLLVPHAIPLDQWEAVLLEWKTGDGKGSLAALLIHRGLLKEAVYLQILAEATGAPVVDPQTLLNPVPPSLATDLLYERGYLTFLHPRLGKCFTGGGQLPASATDLLGPTGADWSFVIVSPLREFRENRPRAGAPQEDLEVLLETLCARGAVDIHFEANPDQVVLRARFQSTLVPIVLWDLSEGQVHLARLKALAGLEPSGMGTPQDARLQFSFAGHSLTFRLSWIRTADGESLTLRRHASLKKLPGLSSLGLSIRQQQTLINGLRESPALILIAGATGSGKTTTLYALLQLESSRGRRILTIEDPVELNLPDILQSQVEEARGWTFAAACRAFLRQDPDVIVIGEIRDAESAQMAIRAAMTGHRVYATIHARSAAAARSRFHRWGIASSALEECLGGVIHQQHAPTMELPQQRSFSLEWH